MASTPRTGFSGGRTGEATPGAVAFLGSGETASTGRRTHQWLFERLPRPVRVAILETPAGFELNSAQVAGRIADFLRHRLQNYHPQVSVVPARRREDADDPEVARSLLQAHYLFLGPGSPTYAVRHLRDTRTWHTLVARHRLGATLCFASAAAIAVGAFALPVYEVYKAGEDPHWRPGLDLLAPFGLRLVVVTHWNNREGGEHLDTSRCYMGRERMAYLLSLLPADVTVVGVDEHTALILDLAEETCWVLGSGGVTLVRQGEEATHPAGRTFPLGELGAFQKPAAGEGVPPEVWEEAVGAQPEEEPVPVEPLPEEVAAAIAQREEARRRRDFATADAIRQRLAERGYRITDTPDGPQWERVRP